MCRQLNSGEPNETSTNAALCNTNEEISYFFAVKHLAWNGSKFVNQSPSGLPKKEVGVKIMSTEYRRYLNNVGSFKPKRDLIAAFTDTCAQACVSDLTILSKLGVTHRHLIPTSHKIISVGY